MSRGFNAPSLIPDTRRGGERENIAISVISPYAGGGGGDSAAAPIWPGERPLTDPHKETRRTKVKLMPEFAKLEHFFPLQLLHIYFFHRNQGEMGVFWKLQLANNFHDGMTGKGKGFFLCTYVTPRRLPWERRRRRRRSRCVGSFFYRA